MRKRKWLIAALLLTMVVVGSLTGVAFASSDENQTDQPTVTAVAPTSGAQGETLDVTITGTYFTGATLVSFGSEITVNSYDVDSDTQITADVSIAADAATGARDVSVTTTAGTGTLSGSGGFTVETQQEALLYRVCQIYEANTGTAIDPQQLKAAFDQAMKEKQDEAMQSWLQKLVSEGKITQEEADQYLAWWQARPDVTLPGPGGLGFGGGMERGRGFGDLGGPNSVPDASD